jgi:hypothetical protein
MELPDAIFAGAFALTLLLTLDGSIWWRTKTDLSLEFEKVDLRSIRRDFPGRNPFLMGKLLLGAAFVASFVAAYLMGASKHLGLGVLSLALLALFGCASFWEGIRAFRHYAAHHLPPVDRGGYIQR